MSTDTSDPQHRRAAESSGASPAKTPGLTRRSMVSKLAALGIGATAVGAGATYLVTYEEEAHAATKAPAKKQAGPEHAWCMVIDLRTCDGCQKCTKACQKRHGLREEQTWIKVYEMEDERGGTFNMPRPCMMCEDPPCLKVCPVSATLRTDEGLVLVDTDDCVGSRACMAACPYEARYFNWQDPLPAARMPMPNTH